MATCRPGLQTDSVPLHTWADLQAPPPKRLWQQLRTLRSSPPGNAASGHRRETFNAALEQAEQLLTAARTVGVATQPILTFYGVSQIGRAAAKDFYRDWDRSASDVVAILRAEAGRDPFDKGLTELIGELSTRSEDFRTRWGTHNVRLHRTGTKRLRHPVVGDLDLSYEAMELTADADLTMFIYTAEPDSPPPTPLPSWPAGQRRLITKPSAPPPLPAVRSEAS